MKLSVMLSDMYNIKLYVTLAAAFQFLTWVFTCSATVVASSSKLSYLYSSNSCSSRSFCMKCSWSSTSSRRQHAFSLCCLARCSWPRTSRASTSNCCLSDSWCCMQQHSYNAWTHRQRDSQALLTSCTDSGTNWGLWTIWPSCCSCSFVTL